MRVPLSWLREYAQLPGVTGREVAERLIAAGLEVETVDQVGGDVTDVVVGEVLEIEELTGYKKPIRYCQVRVSPDGEPHGIICGAVNFPAGARVPVALPGAVLPGGFKISAKKSYGHVSDGMICSAAELGIGEDHSGILVLDPDAPLGADFAEYAGLRDEVLDIAVTPDRGYCLSVRGVAREAATAFGAEFRDPAGTGPSDDAEGPEVHPASIADPDACDRFVLREVRGFDPGAPTPLWMRVRLARAGMRPVSLAVDITNYLMLELGQPLHAFDSAKLRGPIVVRRARPGERLETLDHVERELDPDDILITDSSGPISMAGTMGGLHTEIDEASTDLVIEAAHFSAAGTARMIRRHRISSEASYRFERGVDRGLPLHASARAVRLLASLGGAAIVPGCTHAQVAVPAVTITMAASHPDRVAGVDYGREVVERRLRDVGCEVRSAPSAAGVNGDMIEATPPSWRPDLTAPNDLAEEVIRLEGYENIPVRLPRAPAGRGLTLAQRTRRIAGRALASAGYAEVLSPPFVSERDFDALQLPPDDPQRRALRLVNPVSEDEPLLRTTLLPGLLRTVVRNTGRGFADLALYEMGLVYLPGRGLPDGRAAGNGDVRRAPRLPVDRAPTERELEELEAALPNQPLRAAAVVTGDWEPAGWWGPGRAAGWADAVEAARTLAGAVRVPVTVRAGQAMPWHPGRCAEILVSSDGAGERLIGHAGELHPRVVQAFGLPPRTCAMEIDLSVIEPLAGRPAPGPRVSAYPVATQDVALVVEERVPAAEVAEALRAGAGELLEEIRLFDVYTGAQAGEGRKSLAYRLRFRAPDRTLTTEEVTAARDAAVAEASCRTGAILRAG